MGSRVNRRFVEKVGCWWITRLKSDPWRRVMRTRVLARCDYYRVTKPKRPVICEQVLSLAENLAVIPDGFASISSIS